ncbi:MAG: VOC family protein [Microcella pacifica]
MDLGAFSVSLAVKDLAASREFYSALGVEVVGGQAEEGWLILRNGTTNLGMFQGMFEGNILTFNPGWSAEAQNVDHFTDVRQIENVAARSGHRARREGRRRRRGPRPHHPARPRWQRDPHRPASLRARRPRRRFG